MITSLNSTSGFDYLESFIHQQNPICLHYYYLLPGIENLAGDLEFECTMPLHVRLNISVAIDPRLLKLKIWNLWEQKILFEVMFFSPQPIRLIVLLVNQL